MNFASHSVKNKSARQCASFSLNIEMTTGHFFAVLDFSSHDYANLEASLSAKLQTVAASFTSVSSFSPDLFLGFMAKEINNFVHNLAEQSGDAGLRCSAALIWLDSNELSCLVRGDTGVTIRNEAHELRLGDRSKPREPRLGANYLETPVSGEIETATLKEADVVFLMTSAVSDVFDKQQSETFDEHDAQAIADSLLQATQGIDADRAFVVITGPYSPALDAKSANQLRASLAALESRLNAMTSTGMKGDEAELTNVVTGRVEEKFGQTIAELKDHLSNKPSTLDFLELDEKVKSLGSALTGKAEKADVLELRRELHAAATSEPVQSRSGSLLLTALVLLALAAGAGFLGSWLALRRANTRAEVWSVKTSGSEIALRREDVSSEAVILAASHPLTAGEQKFSSFSDAQRYISTLNSVASAQPAASQTPTSSPAPESTAEIIIKPGDSLKKLAQVYNVPEEKIKNLNPEIRVWSAIQIGQKIVVPAALPTPSISPTPASDQTTAAPAAPGTTEITVGPGDSLNELARRFNTTAARLKELNPQMNWPRIHAGQKVTVPAGG